ncbi:hypothetical protein [Methanosarcina sp. UBA411]|uniref:hypothetical protein n=1 Tax=Methanosarcina sp. UBA411 TaxID=1915589 RepID=UPI0025D9A1DB|nr:hypothetical protein [Methanosarcina sp. UBA411]
MLPDETKILKPVFTFIKDPKNKESLRLLFLLSVFLFLIISPGAAAASSSWEFIPENPAVGDIMEIKGNGFEGETAKVVVTFEKEVEVQNGKYEYILEDIVIPSSSYNSFTVQAEGVEDLNVRAKMLIWTTKSAKAKDGTATVSQTSVPSGKYQIRIDGKATGSDVKLKITAMQEIDIDSEGSLSYLYSTKSIPAGDFEVKVEGITKQIELRPSKILPSEINSSTEQNVSEEQNNESLPSEANSSTEQNSSEKEDNASLGDKDQEQMKESNGNSHRSGLKSSSENNIGDNISLMKNKVSSLMGIKSILENPKTFIFEEIKPHIKAKTLTEMVRNPPKVPSFMLGFAGTLLIGLAVLRKWK